MIQHPSVWNTCLLLLRDEGYDLWVSAHPHQADNPTRYRWRARAADGTDLEAENPTELLGLATVHRHSQRTDSEPYWWRVDGPPLATELVEAFRARSASQAKSDR